MCVVNNQSGAPDIAQEIEMSKKSFEFQNARGAFAFSWDVPRWYTCSQHTTLNAARRVESDAYAAMHEACGPSAWSDHYRIIALVDVPMSCECMCLGWIGDGSHYCKSDSVATVRFIWPAGKTCPQTPVPDGWAATHQCGDCKRAEDAADDHRKKLDERMWAVANSVAVYEYDENHERLVSNKTDEIGRATCRER